MDILKAEIERKRKLLLDRNIISDNKRYFKGSELILKETEQISSKKDASAEKTNDAESDVLEPKSHQNDAEHQILPRKEVIRRLRERGEPIILFGETELMAFQRLRKCEILEPEVNKGLRNDFQEALEKVDQYCLNDMISSNSDEKKKENDNNIEEDNLTYENILTRAKGMGRGDTNLDMEVIMQFLQLLLKLWNNHLKSSPNSEKTTTKGKMAFATYTQTQTYLKPLFRKLKNKSLPDDILDSLTIITRHLLSRNYLLASDAYLQMAIGNAPWPIGVTMVGIHARTGREKIFSKNVAHVLNDETQRKYIQALKRLMTKCQQFFPTDPSRCVEYTEDSSL